MVKAFEHHSVQVQVVLAKANLEVHWVQVVKALKRHSVQV